MLYFVNIFRLRCAFATALSADLLPTSNPTNFPELRRLWHAPAHFNVSVDSMLILLACQKVRRHDGMTETSWRYLMQRLTTPPRVSNLEISRNLPERVGWTTSSRPSPELKARWSCWRQALLEVQPWQSHAAIRGTWLCKDSRIQCRIHRVSVEYRWIMLNRVGRFDAAIVVECYWVIWVQAGANPCDSWRPQLQSEELHVWQGRESFHLRVDKTWNISDSNRLQDSTSVWAAFLIKSDCWSWSY